MLNDYLMRIEQQDVANFALYVTNLNLNLAGACHSKVMVRPNAKPLENCCSGPLVPRQ